MGDLHVLIVRNASFDLASNWDSAFRAKPELECPIDNWLRAGPDADLVKPGVTGFRQRLDKIERAAVAFFPIVKSDVADLDRGHALILILGGNGAALQGRNTDRNFESRSWWISRAKCAR